MTTRNIIAYVLVAVVVMTLGALAGWYFFLRGQSQATIAADSARGSSVTAPFGSPTGSTYQNMISGVSDFAAKSTVAQSGPLPQLWHADVAPVAGFAFTGSASSTRLLYVEQGSGYVFAADASTQNIARLTNTLLPKIYEAFITSDKTVVERSLDSNDVITTFSARIATSTQDAYSTTTVAALSGSYLNPNIRALAINPTTNEVFSIEGALPTITGYRMQWDGSKRKSVFTTAVGGWRPMWLPDGRIILLTLPADGVLGYAYALESDGSLTSLVRALPGLTILPRSSSSAMLYGMSTGAGLSLFAQVDSKAAPAILPIRTVADKCVWAPGKDLVAYCAVPQEVLTGNFLDDWYKGIAHTADSWWRIDASAGKAELVYAPNPSLLLDASSPVMDARGEYIAFRNLRDGSLWVLRLKK